MLRSLHIAGFRAFSDLVVPRVGRVTLVVGRNNVGKTTLLEAVHVHASGPAALAAAHRMLERRDEYVEDERGAVGLEQLFFRHNGALASTFSIANSDDSDALEVGTTWAWWDSGGRRMGDEPPDGVDAHRRLVARRSGRNEQLSLPLTIPRTGPAVSDIRKAEASRSSSLLLPCAGYQAEKVDVGRLWDAVVLTEREQQVVEALRVIEPDLERIVMVDTQRSHRTAIAKIGSRSPLPLRSLGDGMNRLFELALGLVSVGSPGTFLVDEVDSGLHFTALADVWRLVFEAAARLDVQVFATTHSWDCIEAFQQAAAVHPAEGVLVRLQRVTGAISAEVFTEEELSIITRESIEVR
ncbi:MAG: AAA family ATPase [Myxococcota bacterium]